MNPQRAGRCVQQPMIDVPALVRRLKISRESASQLVRKFVELDILREITGKKRYRKYLFRDYVSIIARGTET